MSYKINVDFSPIYECITSLVVYQNQTNQYDLDKSWSKTIDDRVSERLKRNLEQEDPFPMMGYLYILIWKSPFKEDVHTFLDWFKGLSIGEIYELIAPFLVEGKAAVDFNEWRTYYIELFEEWVDTYTISEEVFAYLLQDASKKRLLASSTQATDLFERCTNGLYLEPKEGLKEIILVPSVHMAPLNRLMFLNTTIFTLYSVDMPEENALQPPKALVRLTKALGDEKRLKILKTIRSTPKTQKDIAKELKISKSHLHYHLTLLRTAGLIRVISRIPAKSDLFVSRQEIFQQIGKQLEEYVKD